jgi:hypothetical protein
MTRNLATAHSILGSALDLFREGLSCFQNGAYMGSNLVCRSVIETAIYLAISRASPRPPPSFINVDYTQIRAKWGEIRRRAEDLKILTDNDLSNLTKIRERGNFVAHYGQQLDQRLRSPVESKRGQHKLWSDMEEAKDTLRKTAAVLGKIIARILSRYDPYPYSDS